MHCTRCSASWTRRCSRRLARWRFAARLGDLRLRILTTSYLEQVHCYRGDYPRAVELATANLANAARQLGP